MYIEQARNEMIRVYHQLAKYQLIVIVISKFLKCHLKTKRGHQLIHEHWVRLVSVVWRVLVPGLERSMTF